MARRAQHAASLQRMADWTTVAALLVFSIATLVLLGWAFDMPAFRSIVPETFGMKPITGAAFILASVSLLQGARVGTFISPVVGTATAIAVLTIGVTTLLQYALHINLGIDHILFPDAVQIPEAMSGRMSAITATSFVMFAVSRLMVDTRREDLERIFVILTLSGLVLAYLAIIGHAYDANLLISPLPATSVAPITAIASLALFIGVSLLRPDIGWPARISAVSPSGSFVRPTVIAIVIGVPLIGWLRLEGQDAGLYDYRTGAALFATVNILFLIAIIWIASVNADRMDSRRLKLKLKQQDALIRFGAETLQAKSVSELYGQTLDRVTDGLGASFVSLSDIDADTGYVRSYFSILGQPHVYKETALSSLPAASPVHRVLQTGKEVVLNNISRENALVFKHEYIKHTRSGILLPLKENGAVRQFLAAFFPEVRAFDADEMEFLTVITNTLVVARERLSLSFSLEQKNAALVESDRAKSDFLARMSHELRTPMTGVLGIGDLLLMGDLNDNQRALTRNLMRSARVLLDLLNDVLDFSKIEAGQMEIDHTPFQVTAVLDDVTKLFGPLASEKGLRLDTAGPSATYDGVVGDPKRLRQILSNLVNNAIKFTAHGRIAVKLDLEPYTADRVLLKGSVMDTGIGIDTSTLDRLFQPFSQADVSTSRKYGGTGLGLAITKSFITAMGGTITATSTLGQGATFSFTIPLAVDPHYVPGDLKDRDASSDISDALQALKSKCPSRILLAEDNDTSRLLVSTMLTRIGHKVDAVENGAKAVTTYLTHRHDIVLMDMQMPIMDGPEAMRIIRAGDAVKKRVPIIALTADILTDNRQGYLDAGADLVMGKPVDWLTLAAEIDRLVGGDSSAPAITVAAPAQEGDDIIDMKMVQELRAVLGTAQLEKLQTSFINALAEGEEELETAIASRDMERIKRAAHAVKGLTAQYGASRASKIAKSIEIAAPDSSETASLLVTFKDAANETRALLTEMRASNTGPRNAD